MSESESKPFQKGAWIRFLTIYAALFAPYAVITPYFQQMLKYLGYNYIQIGAIQGAMELMAVAAPIVWGLLADRLRAPRGVLALTIVLSLPSFLLFKTVSGGVAGIVAAVLFGLFYKPNIPLTDGLTFRYLQTEGGDYGKIRIGGSLGYIVLVFVFDIVFMLSGGVTVNKILLLFCVSLALQLASLKLVPPFRLQDEGGCREDKGMALNGKFLPVDFLIVILAAFLGRFSMMSYYSFFSRYLDDVFGIKEVGWIWAVGSLCEIPLVFNSQRIIEKVGLKGLFALGLLGMVLRLGGFGLGNKLWVVLALQPLHCLTFGAYHCSTVTYVSRLFPAKYQGSAQGIFSAVTVGLGGLLGSAIGGVVLEHYGYTALYMSFSGVALLALLICLLFVPKK